MEKFRLLPELIRLQDLKNSTCSCTELSVLRLCSLLFGSLSHPVIGGVRFNIALDQCLKYNLLQVKISYLFYLFKLAVFTCSKQSEETK